MISIGSRVVCVNDRFPAQIADWASNIPVRGHIYTVRHIKYARSPVTGESGKGLVLEELDNLTCYGDTVFAMWRFKELVLEEEEYWHAGLSEKKTNVLANS